MERQEGSITIVVVACVVLILLLSLLMVDVGLYLQAKSEAQNAADAAALAAVQESFPLFMSGRDPKSAAGGIASANDATLESAEISPAGERVQVKVSTRPRSFLLRRIGIGPDKVTALAAAEVDLEAILKSRDIWYTGNPAKLSCLIAVLKSVGAKDKCRASTMAALLALQHLGKPYVWGATGPSSFDCSGLVCYVYAQLGIRLPRTTYAQVRSGRAVSIRELVPGDLVFFRCNGHVGIYLGGGWYIHAPHTGDVVKISPLGRRPVSGCRRII